MKIRILDKSKVNHNGKILEKFEVYDIGDADAELLIKSGDAEAVDPNKAANPEPDPQAPVTPKFDAKKEGFKGEAVLTAKQKKELEETGETTNDKGEKITKDSTPVDAKPEEPVQPKEQTEVLGPDGQPLTEEEIAAKAKAAETGAKDPIPSATEAAKTGEEVPTA